MGVRHERLGPGGGPLDRAAQRLGREGDERLLVVVEDLGAEAPAHVGRHHAQLVLRDAQHERPHQEPDHVRVLRGGVERVLPVVRGVVAECHARLHRVRDQAVVHQLQRGHVGGLGEGLLDRRLVLLHEAPVVAEVRGEVVMDLGRAILQRRLHVHHGRKLGDLDLQRLGGVARLGQRLGHHDRHGVADVAHLAVGQHRMLGLLHRRPVLVGDLPAAGQPPHAGEVLRREDLEHAGHGLGRVEADPLDAPVRHVRSHEHRVRLARHVDVVGVASLAGQEAHVLAPLGAGADTTVLGHVVPPPAARAATAIDPIRRRLRPRPARRPRAPP